MVWRVESGLETKKKNHNHSDILFSITPRYHSPTFPPTRTTTMGQNHANHMAPPTPSSFADGMLDLDTIAGHRVLSLLGSGTYGCVLEAECVATHTRVALVRCLEGNEAGKGGVRGEELAQARSHCLVHPRTPLSPSHINRKSSKRRYAATATAATRRGSRWRPSTPR